MYIGCNSIYKGVKIAQLFYTVGLNFRKFQRDDLTTPLSIENANKYCNSSLKVPFHPGLKIDTIK